jgi:serine/threonine protein kinase
VLEDKRLVAIKRSKVMEVSETREFAKEMLILSQINHRNIVKLLGCCFEVEVPMLVYEFVSNGTLHHHIHGRGSNSVMLPVDARLRIAAESAEALSYMHSSASPPILHGDVKPANILIDERYTAKVSDFGASKFVASDEADIATLVQGTCGYLDPEYLTTCMLTDKSDVYSFGVVLLELMTGKKVISFDGPEEGRSLVSRFLTANKENRFLEILDNRMREECRVEVLQEMEDLVLRCVSLSGEDRPEMRQVAETLGRMRKYQQDLVAGDGDTDTDESTEALLKLNDPWITDVEQGSAYHTSMHTINLEG